MSQVTNPTTVSTSEPAIGLSTDEEELRRWASFSAEQGVGDVLVDYTDDLVGLGLLPDEGE